MLHYRILGNEFKYFYRKQLIKNTGGISTKLLKSEKNKNQVGFITYLEICSPQLFAYVKILFYINEVIDYHKKFFFSNFRIQRSKICKN